MGGGEGVRYEYVAFSHTFFDTVWIEIQKRAIDGWRLVQIVQQKSRDEVHKKVTWHKAIMEREVKR